MNSISPVYKLNLPLPSEELISMIRDFSSNATCDSIDKGLAEFHHHSINYADYLFARLESADELLRNQYKQFFPDTEIFTIIGILRNNSNTPACITPHVDSSRALAINYYIELGGDSVVTSFYNLSKEVKLEEAQQYRYDQVTKVSEYTFKSNQWYTFNGSQCHSVENIQGLRLILMIFRETNLSTYNVSDLIEKNTYIMAEKITLEDNKY